MNADKIMPFMVKVIKVPEGPAPEDFRKSWVGLQLPAMENDSVLPERDFTTGNSIDKREYVLVFASIALDILEEKDKDAAQWFRNNIPPGMDFFTFGADEIERMC